MSKFNSLRAVTHRLNNTPVKELPHIVHFLASSIQDCADALKSISGQPSGKNDDLTLQVHKLKARIASLLQDRSAEGRFTAIILVKATVEAGGRDIIASCEPWVRCLLTILSRPDPSSSKRLALVTITRIFSLTRHYPTLVREITTPLLPAFITACMTLGSLHPSQSGQDVGARSSPHLETVLHCLLRLIPDHPSTFRPFASKLHTTLVKFIGDQSKPDHVSRLAQSILVTLHFCAPKNTSGDEWLNACQAVITSIHGIADEILRAVIEDWQPSTGSHRQATMRKAYDNVPSSIECDPLGLPPWEGIYHGSKVLVSLVHLLKTFLSQKTSQLVHLPLGLILDLTSRLLYVRLPASGKDGQVSIRFNPEVGREEREDLLVVLPQIHQSTLDLLSSLVELGGQSILPVCHTIVDQCLWAFVPESSSDSVRLSSYELLGNLMPLMGPSFLKDSFKPLSTLIEVCCKDIGPRSHEGMKLNQSESGSHSKPALNGHADSFMQTPSKESAPRQPQISALETAASLLLYRILEYVPAEAIPHSLRAMIDRTAILNDQKRILLASVLNPATKATGQHPTPSIIPFLARTSQDKLEVESLLRPRMPVIRDAGPSSYDYEVGSDGDTGGGYRNYTASAEKSTGNPTQTTADVEMAHLQDPKFRGERSTEISKQPIMGFPEYRSDVLDRLDNNLDNEAAAASRAGTPKTITTSQAIVKSSPEPNDHSAAEEPFNRSAKRNLDTANVQEAEGSSKRLRSVDLRLGPAVVAPPEGTASTGAAAASGMAVDSNTVIQGGTGVDAASVDEGKGKATGVSPKKKGIGASRAEKAEGEGDDDESGSDIPPLYLKTSSEEEEEDDDDD